MSTNAPPAHPGPVCALAPCRAQSPDGHGATVDEAREAARVAAVRAGWLHVETRDGECWLCPESQRDVVDSGRRAASVAQHAGALS